MLHELSGFRSVFWMRLAGFDHSQPLAHAAANAAKSDGAEHGRVHDVEREQPNLHYRRKHSTRSI